MKILLGYAYYPYPIDVRDSVESFCARIRASGLEVYAYPLTIDPPAHRLSWPQLDALWRRGDPKLLSLYEDLARKLEGFDVFLNWNGINLHPEFVQALPTFNVFSCFDDPESSDDLSKPAAWAYDLSLVGNAAEVERYKEWGVREPRFWPLGFMSHDYDSTLTKAMILNGERNVDVTLLCERKNNWRQERLDMFASAFPTGRYHGAGWPGGFLPKAECIPLYQQTKIGPNFHNSTGPINFRTYALPANGVMLLCDNKSHLSKIYRIGVEAVGFDTVQEAIELCRYYLNHDQERRQIAAAGWERATQDYSEVAVFRLLEKYVLEASYPKPITAPEGRSRILLQDHSRKTWPRRAFHQYGKPPLRWVKRQLKGDK